MNELQFQEEWLSAYLDDELTAEQRQVVEQRLAVDPAAQTMLDDLRRVRAMVSKLPAWSGSELKFAIPSDLPRDLPNSSQNDLADEIENSNDFEAVTHSMRGADETAAWKEPPARSLVARRSTLTWLATAASVLLALGLGYFYWPSDTLEVSQLDRTDRSSEKSATAAPAGQQAAREAELEVAGANITDSASLNAPSLESPGAVDDRMGLSPSAASDDSINSGLTSSVPQSDISNIESNRNADRSEAFMADSMADPMPAPRTQLRMASPPRGGAEESAASEPSMNLRSSIQPDFSRGAEASSELAPPASAKSFAEGTSDNRLQNLDFPQPPMDAAVLKENTADSPTAGPQLQFARSATWIDTRSLNQAAAQAAVFFGQIRPVFDSNTTDSQLAKPNDGAAVSEVLMATLNADQRELSSLFDSVVASNTLLAVESASLTERAEADASESVSEFGQFVTPSRAGQSLPPVSSLVLFVTREEANRILDELKQAGQIASPVWSVQGSVAVPDMSSERVVLMLNGPAK